MKRISAAILASAVVGAGIGMYALISDKEGKTPPYKVAKVERGDIEEAITASGNINAVTTVQVGSQVSGTIRKILVDFNSVVRKGQVIAEIDPQLFEAAVVQAKGNLANAVATLDRVDVALKDAERTLKRNQELLKGGIVSQQEQDTAQTAFDTALAQQKSARAQVDQARGSLEVAETNLKYTTILSPVDGIVISRNVDVGQTVAASFQTPTLFTIAQDLTKMQIDTNVDEADIGRAKVGQTVAFTVDAYPGRTFEGSVIQVRNSPIVTQNVVTYDVVVRVDNRALLLKPGMTANVSISVQRLTGVFKIPNAALRYRPAGQDRDEKKDVSSGPRVYRRGADGRVQPVPVKTGVSDGTFTQLVEGDLKEGDTLVTGENGGKGGNRRTGQGMPGMGGFR